MQALKIPQMPKLEIFGCGRRQRKRTMVLVGLQKSLKPRPRMFWSLSFVGTIPTQPAHRELLDVPLFCTGRRKRVQRLVADRFSDGIIEKLPFSGENSDSVGRSRSDTHCSSCHPAYGNSEGCSRETSKEKQYNVTLQFINLC